MKSLQLIRPHLLVLIGLPGSGKSYFGSKFAETFGAPYIDLHEIENIAPDASAIADLLLREIMKTRQTILLEGRGDTKTDRVNLKRTAREHGYESLFIWVQTDTTTCRKRARKNRLDDDTFDRHARRFSPPASNEDYLVISGKHTYASQAKTVLKRLALAKTPGLTPETRPETPVRRRLTL